MGSKKEELEKKIKRNKYFSMSLTYFIRNLRIISLLLFIFPFVGIIGSLSLNNYLVSFKFENIKFIPLDKFEKNNTFKLECSAENNWCRFAKSEKLNTCNEYVILYEWTSYDKKQKINAETMKENIKKNQKFFTTFEMINKKNEKCILNSKFNNFLYNFFPNLYEIIAKKQFDLGTSEIVNPIIYGETSISNIVKRTPIKYVFKPLMFISVILMILYWYYYNKIFNHLFNTNKKQLFFIFGILSAVFLFFHTFFLGATFESKILTQMRRLYVVFFILFEVLAQAFLIKKIFEKKEILISYLKNKIILCKLFFVAFICLSTLIITAILMTGGFSSKVDFILEWNYFLILIFFYFLSFLIWKKKLNFNPSSS